MATSFGFNMGVPTGDCHIAARVLERRRSAENLDDPEPEQFPPVGERIREARLRAGLSGSEVALRIGLTEDSYRDLEWYDFEAFTNLSLRELADLAGVLHVRPVVLLFGADGQDIQPTMTFENVTALVTRKLSTSGLSAEQLSDLIGWEIAPLLRDPQSLSTYTVEALYCIGKIVDFDWMSAIPDAPKS